MSDNKIMIGDVYYRVFYSNACGGESFTDPDYDIHEAREKFIYHKRGSSHVKLVRIMEIKEIIEEE